jgi:hypothetical protein
LEAERGGSVEDARLIGESLLNVGWFGMQKKWEKQKPMLIEHGVKMSQREAEPPVARKAGNIVEVRVWC